jgi:negative regulator of flagellin synthesis FlgM
MQISSNFSVGGVDAARSTSKSNTLNATSTTQQSSTSLPVDQLDLSPEALGIANTASASEVFRAEKVANLREAIAQGNYDTDDKVSAALDKFLDQLG